MASCIHIEQLLQSHADGELSSAERLMVEEHLADCAQCAEQLRIARSVSARVFEVLQQDRLQEDLTARVMSHLPEMEKSFLGSLHYSRPLLTRRQPRRLLHQAIRLVPVFVPLILAVMGIMLWIAWPTFTFGGDQLLGMVTYCEGPAANGHISHLRQKRARLRDDITNGEIFETGEEGRLMLGLLGPSLVTMFGNSAVEAVGHREITVSKGRIFLDVYRSSHPFRVNTPDGRITVLGTAFQVDVSASGTEVTVVSGEVLVENDKNFALLHRGSQAVMASQGIPSVRHDVNVESYLAEARAIRPNPAAEKLFLSWKQTTALPEHTPTEQLFVVDTKQRPVGTLVLTWVPDPYAEGHASYNVYVSDAAMTPLFKAVVPQERFRDKRMCSIHIDVPSEMHASDTAVLHIALMPDHATGAVETTFTEVSAIGAKQ